MTARIAKLARHVGASAMISLVPLAAAFAQDLTGAGATFPDPIYKKWIAEYAAKAHVQINYQAIGSGGGIKQLQEQTVDFGASDAPATDAELAGMKGGPVYHIPMVMGSVVITYNLPEVTRPLNLTGAVIADIFMGKVTKWNSPEIANLNKGVALPSKDILVVHRTDGSGTTYIFSDFLSNVSPTWKTGPGTGKELKWPVGLGGKGNDGVTGQVKQTPGAIGYVELAYARQNKLPFAAIQNKQNEFMLPSIESTTAAAAGVASSLQPSTDFRLSLVNAPGKGAYPISSMTFILVYQNQTNADKSKKLLTFLKWAIHDGQNDAAGLDYAPLPKNVVAMLDKRLDMVKVAAK
ncbi:MAG TPA: phosphate ABC transporter substrate-binding protein PstS [Gemmatimonadaceae bacterium]|jgi:phosphate transport system substrate-binding protein